MTHEYYERHGGKTIIIAQFAPILRTFAPVVAGVAEMGYRRFASYNVVGAIAWICAMTLGGYLLGNLIPNIDKRIDVVVMVVIAVSLLPAIIAWLRDGAGRPEGRPLRGSIVQADLRPLRGSIVEADLQVGLEYMDHLTLFGLFAVTAMLVTYALEDRSPWFVLAFAGSCVLGSIYGFLQGAWPFGLVEGIWSMVALRRWWGLPPRSRPT